MMNEKQQKVASATPPKKRQPYVPPRVSFVEISVEEALLAICKSGNGSGPTGYCSIPCYNDGS